jgi:hypothetical protein
MAKDKKSKKEEAVADGVLKTKDVAAAMGITPKALRKSLRATDRFADHKYTNYRFASLDEVIMLLTPPAAA